MSKKKELPNSVKKNYSRARASVLRYFIKLFTRQVNASPQAPFEVKRLDVTTFGPKYDTFELRVENAGEWLSRRMTIAPLGEESGSKSLCFYVIYDDHLVIKIPPSPIVNLDRYLEYIYADQRIVFRLEPRECVVPGVSVILKRVHAFPDDRLNPQNMEGKYISWLKKNPEYQEFLKIDDSFVFFMDLSKFGILGDVLNKLQFDKKNRLVQEITENKGIIPEYHTFEGRYGHKRGKLGFDLKNLYAEFETNVHKILTRSKIKPSIFQYKVEEWFLAKLAGKKIEDTETDIPFETINEINDYLETLLVEHNDTISAYKETVQEYLHRKYFTISKSQMEGIITNILDLLAWLREKGVAMRDFKPDNLLVTGDPEKNPNFLSSPQKYSLGLIDVETSVIYKTQGNENIKQPQLGGTPFFATPSQLFQNELLLEVYDELATVLYLQDWYAAIVMIYLVITGNRLFEKTAVKLPAIIKLIEKVTFAKEPVSNVMGKANKIFWESAATEFQANIQTKEELLKSIDVSIPENAQQMFLQNLRDSRLSQTETIKCIINTQRFFNSEKNQEQFLKASSTQITEFIKRLDANKGKEDPTKIEVLKQLETLKQNLEELDNTIRSLVKDGGKMTACHLLEFMFQIVYKYMYQAT